MGRLPFDASKMAAARARSKAPSARADDRPWSVRELSSHIADALARGVPAKVRVVGEVSGLRDRTHLYFDIKDANAVVSCVMFASAARKLKVPLRDGLDVLLTGRVELYAKAGKLSLIVERAEPIGSGALDAAFRELCAQLRELGWFDPARKKPLPILPKKVAVVTSRTSAALQDVLETARQRCRAVGFVLADVRVQGDGASTEVARTIRQLDSTRDQLGIDAILLTRGGGSMEDLWAFNEREVAEAIVACGLPVVAAIGHETDTTIAELVADARASTPTQAAMMLCPDADGLLRQIDSQHVRLTRLLTTRLASERRQLRSLASRPVLRDPSELVRNHRTRLDQSARSLQQSAASRLTARRLRLERVSARLESHRPASRHAENKARLDALADRLRRASTTIARRDTDGVRTDLVAVMGRSLAHRREALDARARELEAVGPMAVLKRGFSFTTRDDGSGVSHESEVQPGDRLVTRLATGRVRSIVEGETPIQRPTKPAPPPESAPTKPRSRPKPDEPTRDQLDLFDGGLS